MVWKAGALPTETRESMRGGDGEARLAQLVGERPAHLRLLSRITLPEGASIGYHVHERETEIFHFLQGEALCRDDDAEVRLCAGDSLSTPSGHGHSVRNAGSGDLVFVAVIVLD